MKEIARDLMIPIGQISSLTSNDAEEVKILATEAQDFLLAHHHWCTAVGQGFLCWGFAKLAIFLFSVKRHGEPIWTWVIVGSIPPAYIDTEINPTSYDALNGYLGELQAWVDAIRAGESLDDVMPVYNRATLERIPPTQENADELEKRLEFIGAKILDGYEEDLRNNRCRIYD